MPRNKPADPGSASDPAANTAPDPGIMALKYEEAVAELERIVQGMESGDLPLEEAIVAYRRGSALLHRCQSLLADAERRIRILEDGMLKDLDEPGGAPR